MKIALQNHTRLKHIGKVLFLIFFSASFFFANAQSQFTLKGNAVNQGGSPATVYRLTSAANSQAGLITNQYVVDLATTFSLTFDLYLGTSSAGADGIAFSISSACSPTLGGGEGLGADPVTMDPGIIVEFDTHENGSLNDDPGSGQEDHIAVYRIDNGAVDRISTTAARLTAGVSPWQAGSSLANGAYHTVVIFWTYTNATSQTLQVSFDGTIRQTHTGDYLSGLFSNANFQFWSISGSTGSKNNEHRVRYLEPNQSGTQVCPNEVHQLVAPSRGTSYTWLPATFTGDGNNNDTISATPETTTTYTCTYNNFCGEPVEVYFVATVSNDLPTGTVTGTTSVCQDAAQPDITFTSTAGTLPVVFSYQINGAATQTVTTTGASTTVTVPAPTTTAGIFTYSLVAITDGSGSSCTNNTPTSGSGSSTITVNPNAAVTLSSAALTDDQDLCVNTAISDITYTVSGGATGAGVTGLPTGVTSAFAGVTLTISGTPTVSAGPYIYTVTTTGTCVQTTAIGTLTVNPDAALALSSAPGTDDQSICVNMALTDITYSVTGGTGATVTALPSGLAGVYGGGVFTISGNPTVAGITDYTVTTTGPCTNTSETGTITVGLSLTSAVATTDQDICLTDAITPITYAVGGATETASAIGLPAGVSDVFAAGVLTISGTPTVSGTFDYTVTTAGVCAVENLTGTITIGLGLVTPGTDTQTVCKNNPIIDIDYNVIGGGTPVVSGFPTGVTGNLVATVFTISGTPSVEGTFDYTITTTGACPAQSSLFGQITVGAGLVAGAGTDTQTVCKNAPITDIIYKIQGGVATVTGLPAGVSSGLNATNDTLTINGTPTVEGAFSYTVSTAGGTCDPNSSELYGEITIGGGLISASGTDTQAVCKNSPITDIVYKVEGGIAVVTGLPSGVTSSLNATNDTLTISGAPTVEGTYSYTFSTAGGTCDPNSSTLYGELTSGGGQISGIGTDTQVVCRNSPIADVVYKIVGGVATVSGLPAGVSSSLNATNDTLTISGTPTVEGTYTYTLSTVGGTCDPNSSTLYGELTIGGGLISSTGTDTQAVCKNSPIADITYKILGGVATVSGLPAGVSSGLNATNDTLTISGIPTVEGTFNYTLSTVGGICDPNATTLYGELTVGAGLISGVGTDTQVVCKNSPITDINYKIVGGIAVVSGLPAGVISSINGTNDTLTISGSSAIEGAYSYTISTLGGTCDPNPSELFGQLVIGVGLISAVGTDTQAVCKNGPITDIVYRIIGDSVLVTGLPTGIVPAMNATKDTLTISGTSTVEGTYSYSVNTVGGSCDPNPSELYGQLIFGEGLVSIIGSDTQAVCKGAPIGEIKYRFVGGVANVYGLPAGIIFSLNASNDTITINGSSMEEGSYHYTVTTAGGACDPIISELDGQLIIGVGLVSNMGTDTQGVCKNAPIEDILYKVQGGVATITGLPVGITASLNATNDTLTISGSSATEGIYTYTLSTDGGACDPDFSVLYGNLTIGGGLVPVISGGGSNTQSVCKTVPIQDIHYNIVGGVAQIYGLPAGIFTSMNAAMDTLTISGTSPLAGIYQYTVTTSGGACDPDSSEFFGQITLDEATSSLSSNFRTENQEICANSPINDLVFLIGGTGTGATISYLPSGLDTAFVSGSFVISGSPDLPQGINDFTVTPTGGACPSNSSVFSITILNPEARFVHDPEYGTAPLEVNLVNTSLDANSYTWYFGEGNYSNAVDTSYTYTRPGIYKIMLIASDNSVCPDTAIVSIIVYKIEVPNVFSPNGDGVNDIFKIDSKGVKTIEAEIFDRWGKKINEWNIVGGGWDGRNFINNRECEEGTYFYLLKITDLDGISHEEQGSVTLLK